MYSRRTLVDCRFGFGVQRGGVWWGIRRASTGGDAARRANSRGGKGRATTETAGSILWRRVAGNPTASGELYDPSGFTAAHKALPFGTMLEVCYHDCAEVTVNDRNPNSEADLDLSLAAADYIGLTPDGNGVVDAEMVE